MRHRLTAKRSLAASRHDDLIYTITAHDGGNKPSLVYQSMSLPRDGAFRHLRETATMTAVSACDLAPRYRIYYH